MKVAIYARVSTDDKGQDPLNQLLELREFASRQGGTVVTDEASAKNGERTGFHRCGRTWRGTRSTYCSFGRLTG